MRLGACAMAISCFMPSVRWLWVVMLMLAACGKRVTSQNERDVAAYMLDEMRRVVERAEAERRAALGNALTTLVPRPDLGPCSLSVSPSDQNVARHALEELDRLRGELSRASTPEQAERVTRAARDIGKRVT